MLFLIKLYFVFGIIFALYVTIRYEVGESFNFWNSLIEIIISIEMFILLWPVFLVVEIMNFDDDPHYYD